MEKVIAHHKVSVVKENIEAINKKFARKKLAPITYTVGETYSKEEYDMYSHKKYLTFWNIFTIESPIEEIKTDGYEFKGSITKKKNEDAMVMFVPEGTDFDLTPYIGTMYCDHCKTNRVRNDIYVFEKEGKFYTFGSNCVDEFFGYSVEKLIYAGALMDKFFREDDVGYVEDFSYQVHIDYILASAFYLEKFNRYDSNIKNLVRRIAESRNEEEEELIFEDYPEFLKWCESCDDSIITKIQEHVSGLPTDTNFNFNMKQVFMNRSTYSPALVACGVNSYYKANNLFKVFPKEEIVEQVIEGKEAKPSFVNVYLPQDIGDKVTKDIEIVDSRSYSSQYGIGYIYTIRTSDGYRLKWFTNKEEVPSGMFKAQFTIKGHDEYRCNNSTVVTRVKEVK